MSRQYIGIETADGQYLEGWAETDDLDDQFTIETDDGRFKVNGWMLSNDDIEYLK